MKHWLRSYGIIDPKNTGNELGMCAHISRSFQFVDQKAQILYHAQFQLAALCFYQIIQRKERERAAIGNYLLNKGIHAIQNEELTN